MQIVYLGLFGGLGCIARYLVSGWTYQLFGRSLPYGTLVVNLIGTFMLGLLMEAALRSSFLSPELRIGLTVGFLGGFTTFSTFSYETLRMLEDGNYWGSAVTILLNVLGCLMAGSLGIYLARQG
ncbi:MAG: fluoride efflux transporter CrcB [Desulfuromonas sp.]|nr:MAG: fluoride efflux transporter CrcB [Desulfuromonas sp.]